MDSTLNFIISNQNNIVFIILAIIVLILIFIIWKLNNKLNKFLIGNKVENIGESIKEIGSSLKDLELFRKDLEEYLTSVEKRIKKSTQGVATVRFNPFKGTGSGGNQSFATAFLNEQGDGVVISSIYAREHISIFSKPVKKCASEYELSQEEKEAITLAMEMIK